jgi:FdrA protein
MPVRAETWRSFYQDSMVLMRLAAALRERAGVREAAALMGTPANHELLGAAGLAAPEVADAVPGDLMLVVDAEDEAAAQTALAGARDFFDQQQRARAASGRSLPRTIESALRHMPDASLALVSVPGAYAALEARTALMRGLHVFLFSDNVSVEDEVALKQLAARRGLLCMGPDCGTAYVGGVGLGFANVVPRGRIGCVAASGTGLQAVASHIAALGEGVSHGIGVGGRDLSAAVGGIMTTAALARLASDTATEVIVLISKPPAASVMADLDALVARIGKPVVVCCLGAVAGAGAPGHRVATLEEAALAAVALARGRSWRAPARGDVADLRARLARARSGRSGPRHVLGLYSGGTLAHEAALLLSPLLGGVETRDGAAPSHRILDLGADEFTVGRPHPMIDPAERGARIRRAAHAPDIGVLLVDLVLGRAAHPDPARPLVAAIRDAGATAAAAGRSLAAVASVVGTEGDPQNLRAQIAALEAAGVEVLPSNAQACRLAALLAAPDLEPELLAAMP